MTGSQKKEIRESDTKVKKNENENIRYDFKNQNIKNYNSKILHEHDNMKMIT